MLAGLLVALVVGAVARLRLIGEHLQVDLVDAAAAGGDAVDTVADVLYLGAARAVEAEAAKLAGGGWWRWCWLR
jgi:hypothetical protein